MIPLQQLRPDAGSHDGSGAGDHDVPYRFGRVPRAEAPYPFSTRQYPRLLVLRSRIQADLFATRDVQARIGLAPGAG
jgi:hypothetical protein